ncbi:hypothetical protein B6R96_08435 [Streptomyces sp. Sge12]|uniref:hypothetical protein n=1 Tax=Streptomyces sp. Sge12 TaxID=1972846 RepID=UPI0009C32BB1|nr:hypothetical protein [Streptomyces sp. Sge12]ARE73958.1 hypothetical protein B6R96_08435 [Streptomyces sp. Sge12]
MAGTEFGHAIGPSRALSGLPLAPLQGGYGELLAAQQGLGLRHLGELLVPPGGRLRVLDGIFAVTGPARRLHVGTGVLRALRREQAPAPGCSTPACTSCLGIWARGRRSRSGSRSGPT